MTHPDIRYVVSEAEALPRGLPFVAPDNASANRKNLYREILIHQPRALADFLNLKSHEGGVRVVCGLSGGSDSCRSGGVTSKEP